MQAYSAIHVKLELIKCNSQLQLQLGEASRAWRSFPRSGQFRIASDSTQSYKLGTKE